MNRGYKHNLLLFQIRFLNPAITGELVGNTTIVYMVPTLRATTLVGLETKSLELFSNIFRL